MSKKYQIGTGKNQWVWESNIVQAKGILPIRLEEIKDHALDTKQRVFCLESLDEHKSPPHELGDMIFFTKNQAKDLIKFLQEKTSE